MRSGMSHLALNLTTYLYLTNICVWEQKWHIPPFVWLLICTLLIFMDVSTIDSSSLLSDYLIFVFYERVALTPLAFCLTSYLYFTHFYVY